jgi:hypothetical protein
MIESVEIRWPSGAVETLRDVTADTICTIVEGQGITDMKQLPPPAEKVASSAH